MRRDIAGRMQENLSPAVFALVEITARKFVSLSERGQACG